MPLARVIHLEFAMPDNIPLGQWSGSDAVDALHDTIKGYQGTSAKQTATVIQLTRWIVVLTVVMTMAVVVQIVVMLR